MSPLSLLRSGWRRVSQSQRLGHWLLDVNFPPAGRHDRYFDLTTHPLVRTVAPRLTRGSRVLDMGTGAFASVGIALWRRSGCHVLSTDIHPEIVRRARENIAANGAPIQVIQTRFFDGIEERFDVVTFNIPYVPSRLVADRDVPQPFPFQSDGGPDGTSVIQEFLDAFCQRPAIITAYLGVNALLVSRKQIVPLIERHSGLKLKQVVRPLVPPVDVYVVQHR